MKAGSALMCLLLAGCSQDATGGSGATEVGRLVLRDYQVTIKLGQQGRLYDVVSRDGRKLATDADTTYLAEHLPEVHEQLQGIWAGL